MRTICVTFDVDFTDYLSETTKDELEVAFEKIKETLLRFPNIQTTWFFRIDHQIEKIFGQPEYIFSKHKESISWLKEHRHEIAWHHHAYVQRGNIWSAEDDPDNFAKALKKFGACARSFDLTSARMGWGQQTPEGMAVLEGLGFKTDSSAIPRPNYKWASYPLRDWNLAPQTPYYPSDSDCSMSSKNIRDIVEVPISTIVLPFPKDSMDGVKRYINLAYHPHIFQEAILKSKNNLVTISHPYEFIPRTNLHDSLSFNFEALGINLSYLEELGFTFQTVTQYAESFRSLSVLSA